MAGEPNSFLKEPFAIKKEANIKREVSYSSGWSDSLMAQKVVGLNPGLGQLETKIALC